MHHGCLIVNRFGSQPHQGKPSRSESLDIDADLGSTVANDYYGRRPFEFDGRIHSVKVSLK